VISSDAQRQASVEEVAGDRLEGGPVTLKSIHAVASAFGPGVFHRIQCALLDVAPHRSDGGRHHEAEEMAFVPGRFVDRL
jgi:hypothetical protein